MHEVGLRDTLVPAHLLSMFAKKPTIMLKIATAAAAALALLAVAWNIGTRSEAIGDRILRVAMGVYDTTFSLGNLKYLAAVALAFVIELLVLGYRASSIRRLLKPSRSAIVDIFSMVCLLTGLGGIISFILSLGVASILSDKLSALVPRGALAIGNPVLQTFWLLVISDFIRYWTHVLSHKVPFIWEAHKFHHSADEMNLITTARGHPIEGAIGVVVMAIPTALLDGTAEQFVVLATITTVWGCLAHSMLEWRFGWAGRWLLNSPVNHRIHHSEMTEHCDRNFASMFVLWDRLFGTYYKGDRLNTHVGVSQNPYNQRALWYDLLLCPLLCASQAIKDITRLGVSLRRTVAGLVQNRGGAGS